MLRHPPFLSVCGSVRVSVRVCGTGRVGHASDPVDFAGARDTTKAPDAESGAFARDQLVREIRFSASYTYVPIEAPCGSPFSSNVISPEYPS